MTYLLNLVFSHCLVVLYVCQHFTHSPWNVCKSSRVITLRSYPKILIICKLFEVNRPPHDFTQVDPTAERGPGDLPEEHLPEALKLKTG